jgi:hypothetical protein
MLVFTFEHLAEVRETQQLGMGEVLGVQGIQVFSLVMIIGM